jgi:predicted ArsR family transcriptional regulator
MGYSMMDIYKITDLEQVRLLADPLKLQLLQAFAESPKTTKQVADELGEKVTKLYRHVDALHAAGLLGVVEEKKKRGTIERTFRAVAHRFEADHSLFANDAGPEVTEATREMLRISEAEILGALEHLGDGSEDRVIITRIRGKASPAKVEELRAALLDWLDSLATCEQSAAADAQDIGGLIAFYPID